jgi:preprotein translocase subunit YajC
MDLSLMLANGSSTSQWIMIVVYVVVFGGIMYFLLIRPQKKQQNKVRDLIASMEVGDTVLTSSGFFGVLIDISDDTVTVEFGNNKNCRIPMQKNAIVQVEKATEGME